jgi:hypothetical protein
MTRMVVPFSAFEESAVAAGAECSGDAAAAEPEGERRS